MKIKPKFGKSGFTIADLIIFFIIFGVLASTAILAYLQLRGEASNKEGSLSVEQKLENAERTIAELKASIAESERAAIETLHRFDDEELLRDKVSIYSGSEKQRIYLLNIPFYIQNNRDSIGAEPDFTIGNALAAFARRVESKEKMVACVPFPTTHRPTPHTQGVLIITEVIAIPSAEKPAQ